jgi:hypothetical protein
MLKVVRPKNNFIAGLMFFLLVPIVEKTRLRRQITAGRTEVID